jgi:[protein-PII] uridylyltransferase
MRRCSINLRAAPKRRKRLCARSTRSRALIAARHARFNDTLYQLEPDLKESPGGLRDLFAALTIAKLTDPGLLGRGGSGPRALDDAEEFMLRVRSILHLEAKRHHNVLTHELQERAAEYLDYTVPRRVSASSG